MRHTCSMVCMLSEKTQCHHVTANHSTMVNKDDANSARKQYSKGIHWFSSTSVLEQILFLKSSQNLCNNPVKILIFKEICTLKAEISQQTKLVSELDV